MMLVDEPITLSQVVDIIILIGALCAAIYKIWDFFAKPTSYLKKRSIERERIRIKTILDEELPKRLYDHDLQTRDKYKSDRQNYLNEIKEAVIQDVGSTIDQNKADLEALKISSRDVLREKIMGIYHKNKADRSMNEYEREALDQYYKDYKALNGNSYIDKRMKRMDKWSVIFDEEIDDEE